MPMSQAIWRVSSRSGKPEIAKLLRNQPAVMVAGEQIRRTSRGIIFMDRRNIFVTQK